MPQPLARVVGKTWAKANSRRHQTAFQTSVRAPGLGAGDLGAASKTSGRTEI